MIARGVYWIVLRRITTLTTVRFSSDKNGKDMNTQQSIKKVHTQQIGKKNVNDGGLKVNHTEKFSQAKEALKVQTQSIGKRNVNDVNDQGLEVDHTQKFTKSSLLQPQAKEALKIDERFEKIAIVTENMAKIYESEHKKLNTYILIGTLFITAVTLWISNDNNRIQKQRRAQEIKKSPQTLRKERIKKYAEQDLDINPFENQIYSKNSQNSTYKQLKLIVDKENVDGFSRLQVVTGLPGNGKTTQIKRIAKDLRKQGHIVFYVNLRDTKKGETTAEEALAKAEEAMSQFYKTELRPNEKQKAFLFIDDINMLESLQNSDQHWMRLRIFWTQMAIVHRYYNFKTVVISSSSTYMSKLEMKSYVKKASQFQTIKNKTTEQMRQSIENIFDFYLKEKTAQYQNVKRYLLDERYNLRDVMERVDKFQLASTEEKFLKDLKTQEESIIRETKKKIFKKLLPVLQKRTNKQQKYDQGLLAEIVKLKQFDGTNGCLQVSEKFQQLKIKDMVIQKTQGLQNYLEQENNLLFFCFPRSEMDRKIVQGLLDLMKGSSDK